MNAALACLVAAGLLTACAGVPTRDQKQDAINAALASAYVACSVALSDPRMEFEAGAREYCEAIVAGGCK